MRNSYILLFFLLFLINCKNEKKYTKKLKQKIIC